MLPALAAEEPPKKRVLTHADQDIWNTATGVSLSPDGKFLAYTVAPAVGEATFVVKNIPTGAEYKFYAGTRTGPAAPGTPATGGSEEAADADQFPVPPGAFQNRGGPSGGPTFTPDSKSLYFVLQPTKAELDKAKADKKLPPRPVLAVLDTATGQVVTRHEKVRSFSVVGDGAGILVRVMEPEPEAKAEPKKEPKAEPKKEPKAEPKKEVAPIPKAKGDAVPDQQGTKGPKGKGDETPTNRSPTGSDLIVTDLGGGKEVTLDDVLSHTVTKDFRHIVYTVGGKVPAREGVYFSPLFMPTPTTVMAGPGRYTGLVWDEKQTKLAFYFTEDAPKPDPKKPAPPSVNRKPNVYLWARDGKSPAVKVLGPDTPGLKKDWEIVNRGSLDFSADGMKLAVNTAEIRESPPPATKVASDPAGGEDQRPGRPTPTPRPDPNKVELDLWHWKDEAIQPMQKVRAAADRTRTYRAVYFLDTKEFRHLADEDHTVTLPEFGDWAVGGTNKKYRGQTWNYPSPSDYALVNIRNGESKPIVAEHVGGLSPSSKGKYLAGFDGEHWFTVSVPDGKKTILTAKVEEKFFNEEHDSPSQTPAYGIAGWGTDDQSLYVYDRFDLWKFAADGSEPPVNVTRVGRRTNTHFRLIRVEKPDDPDATPERGLNPSFPWLFSADNVDTRDTGFYRLPPGGEPKLLVMGARKYGTPTKAKDAGVFVFTVQTFSQHPDYYVADTQFTEIKRVTDLNPQVTEYNWGTAELVPFKTTDGDPLQAILVKPENFDPSKKYPMVVYIYERLTDNLHTFRVPSVTRGQTINPTFYASNGYLVLMPDITYKTGFPGQSAMKCVLPAIQAVADKGFVNEKAIGINGQSWGGYQIAYMVTQTNRFKAAVAGAPVSNMTSAYNGIRWGTGLPRQFQYEKTQSRIGETLWQAPLRYLENSPVFAADRVETPLMMIHNDQDDAVPWYQGVEYYLALRRLEKEVYLLNYNGEPHNLRRPANARDFALRMHQFFDHHLKGKPMPEWMAKGVPYLDRETEKEQWKKFFEPAKK
jgi:dipeptidyl aminopeptidase/acylaminoacyl peptidase